MRWRSARRALITERTRDGSFEAWADAVVANGGSVSEARANIVERFIAADKVSGAWALTDDLWAFWAENVAQALTSLKQRRLATAVNSPTFTADRHYAFDGVSSYLNTGFIPSTHGVNFTGTNQRLGVYPRVNSTSSGRVAGTRNTSASSISMIPRLSSAMQGTVNNTAGTPSFTISPADSRGLKIISRASGSTTAMGYDRGVRLTDSTGLTVGTGVSTVALFVGGNNDNGALASPRASSVGFAEIGGPLSDAQELAHYTAVQAWATAVGANV